MNDNQRSKHNMLQAVLGVMADYSATVNKYKIISETVAELSVKVSEVAKTNVMMAADPTALTDEKRKVKEQMAVLCSELAAAGAAYASDNNLIVIEKNLNVSYSDIRYGNDSEAVALAEFVHSELTEIGAKILKQYLIKQSDLDQLDEIIVDFGSSVAHKGSTKSQRVAGTKQLSMLFVEADTLLEKCDRLMKRIQRKESELFNAYNNARVIIG